MSKIIAYQTGLEEIAESLSWIGYRTVNIEDASDGCDAILVSDSKISFCDLPEPNENGAIIINVSGKSQKEILNTLIKRSYHPLFDESR